MTKIKKVVTGFIEENCYILYQDKTALIVDPGADADKIKAALDELGLLPLAILLTHAHYDHIGAVEELRLDYGIPVYIHPAEQEFLQNPSLNLSASLRQPIICQKAEFEFEAYENLAIGDFLFQVLPTPGHSPGSVSFVFEEAEFVICGDALFNGSIGRTDLPGSSTEQLLHAIETELFSLPNHFKAYPGHGPSTLIGKEIQTNPFFS